MRSVFFLLLIGLMLILQGCLLIDDGVRKVGEIKLVNESIEQISYCQSNSLIGIENDVFCYMHNLESEYAIIMPKDFVVFPVFNSEYYNNKQTRIFIYKRSTLDSYSWNEIVKKKLYDKRYSYSLEELKAMNWTIIYDGK
ncbi:hypothetical protein [Myroides sp. LoEW2-1]|uniref:hypothetical protein n=1 Tax=Myroides sp. LoEW2-1 TaxID=2683192 RepID=UPI001321B7EB|nr:hypothetical protein [Myroides sp. LoEW2-1]MVX35322.1 hypothetical protein [Myroides sp. LoEW2-1]